MFSVFKKNSRVTKNSLKALELNHYFCQSVPQITYFMVFSLIKKKAKKLSTSFLQFSGKYRG
jgi:hypothetical protein